MSRRPYLKKNLVTFKQISVCGIPEAKATQVLSHPLEMLNYLRRGTWLY